MKCQHGFKKGQKVIITGDSANFGHGLKAGDEVILDLLRTWPSRGEGVREGWRTACGWEVSCHDLCAPPTDDEVREAINSILQGGN